MAFSLTVYMMRILYLHYGELTGFLHLCCFQFESCLHRDRCSHWAVIAFLGSSRRSVRHPAVLHRSTQPLACFPPPVFMPSPGPSLLSSSMPVKYPPLLTVKWYGSGPCQPLCPLCSVMCQIIPLS